MEVAQHFLAKSAIVTRIGLLLTLVGLLYGCGGSESMYADYDAVVNWQPSDYYEDGTIMAYNEISHYQVVFGKSPDQLDSMQEVSLSELLSYHLNYQSNEPVIYLAVQTVSIYGEVSEPSSVVMLEFELVPDISNI